MRQSTAAFIAVSALALGFTSCRSATWDNDLALDAVKLEIQVEANGSRVEVEYHVRPSTVPAAVQGAMRAMYPGGGEFTDAEVEWHEGTKFYELSMKVAGHDVEAMFYPDGRFFQGEVQVPSANVSQVCKTALLTRFPSSQGASWEEIRDANKKLVEYHAKTEVGGKHYKVMLNVDGTIRKVVRETVAEIEVPLAR